MELLKQEDKTMLEIGRCEKEILGEMVVYSLFMKRENHIKTYGIRISRGADNESCYLNGDLFRCVSFLERLINGEVFPYSLHELAEDFLGE